MRTVNLRITSASQRIALSRPVGRPISRPWVPSSTFRPRAAYLLPGQCPHSLGPGRNCHLAAPALARAMSFEPARPLEQHPQMLQRYQTMPARAAVLQPTPSWEDAANAALNELGREVLTRAGSLQSPHQQQPPWEVSGLPTAIQDLGRRILHRASSIQHRGLSITLCLMQGGYELLQHTGILGDSQLDYVLPALFFTALFREATQTALAVTKRKGIGRDVTVASSLFSVLYLMAQAFSTHTCIEPAFGGCEIPANMLWMSLTLMDPLWALLHTADDTVATAETLAKRAKVAKQLSGRPSRLDVVPEQDNEGPHTEEAEAEAEVKLSPALSMARTLSAQLPWMAVAGAAAMVVGGDAVRDYLTDNLSHFQTLNMSWTTLAVMLSTVLRNSPHPHAKVGTTALVAISHIFHADSMDALKLGLGSSVLMSGFFQ